MEGAGAVQFSVEFVVPDSAVELLRKNVSRVKKLFNVDVKFSTTFERGDTTMRWVSFDGGQSTAKEMKDAKAYITSMTNPSTSVSLDNVPPSLYQSSHDQVEAETCAFLSRDGNSVSLQGSQLAVVLAQSMLESAQHDVTAAEDCSQKQNIPEERPVEEGTVSSHDGKLSTGCQDTSNNQDIVLNPDPSPSHRLLETTPTTTTTIQPKLPSSPSHNFHSQHRNLSPRHSPKKPVSVASKTVVVTERENAQTSDSSRLFSTRDDNSNLFVVDNDWSEMVDDDGGGERFAIMEDKNDGKREILDDNKDLKTEILGDNKDEKTEILGDNDDGKMDIVDDNDEKPEFLDDNNDEDDDEKREILDDGSDDDESDVVSENSATSDLGMVMQYDSLRNVGLSHGYASDVIQEGLKHCDMTDIVKPDEFLNILKSIAKPNNVPATSSSSASNTNTHTVTTSKTNTDTVTVSNTNTDTVTTSTVAASNTNTDTVTTSTITSSSSSSSVKVKKSSSSSSSWSPRQGSVILIDSDSENWVSEEGEVLEDCVSEEEEGEVVEAYVISSEEEEETDSPFRMKKKKKRVKKEPAASKAPKKRPLFPAPSLSPHPPTTQPTQEHAATASPLSPALRHIVIDGNNVAMHHGNHVVYSVKGIQICINYFLSRGHKVTAFVTGSRRFFQPRKTFPMKDKQLLDQLEKEGHLKFTPSRRLSDGRVISSYDDRFVLNLADAEKGIVVSNDQYRDLLYEKPSYRQLIEYRLLPYMFVGDLFMPPDDPLGRHGPDLDDFLRFPRRERSGGSFSKQPFSNPGPNQLSPAVPPPAKRRKVLTINGQNTRGGEDLIPLMSTTTKHKGPSGATATTTTTTCDDEKTEKKLKTKPIRHLRKLHPDAKFQFVNREGRGSLAQTFTMDVTVDDQTFEGSGTTKKQAKQEAAKKALEQILGNTMVTIETGSTADALRNGGKDLPKGKKGSGSTPIKDLRKHFPDLQFSFVKCSKGKHSTVFTMAVTANDRRFQGCGSSKKLAKQMAARTALKQILGSPTKPKAEEMPSQEENPILKLQKIHRNIKFMFFERTGPLHASVHTTECVVNGKTFPGTGPSKKLAKYDAVKTALRKFLGEDAGV